MNTRVAENLLQLSEARSSVDASRAFSACVSSTLGLSSSDVVVFVWDLSEDGLLQCHGKNCMCETNESQTALMPSTTCHCLPTSGILRQAVAEKTEFTVQAHHISNDDPLDNFLQLSQAPSTSVVHCCSVRGRHDADRTVAAYSALVSSQPPPDTLGVLTSIHGILAVTLERLASACEEKEMKQRYKLVSKLMARQDSSIQLASQLCSIVGEMTGASSTAFLSVTDTDDQLVCQLVNAKPLTVELVFPVTNGPFAHGVSSGNVHILSSSSMFHEQLRQMVGYAPSSVLCTPIVDKAAQQRGEKAVVAILTAFHKDGHIFSAKDIRQLQWLVTYSHKLYLHSVAKEAESLGKLLNQTLLNVAKSLFNHIGDLNTLLTCIMDLAKELTCAERCSVFLLETNRLTGEEELVAHIFDNVVPTDELKLPLSKGIAALVAQTGELKNIPDVYKCPEFNQDIDQKSGFQTRNILCFPIYGQKGILGVAQLCNKTGGAHHFTHVDEELAKAFAVYCGISICHSMLYRRALEAQNRSQLATELLIYHMQVPEEDVESHCRMVVWKPAEISKDFVSFRFMDTMFTDSETIRMLVTMFDDMGLISRWRIPKENLCRFLLMVQKGYREPPYHNWRHAVSVAQFCYCLWKRCGSLEPLTELEVLGLFVASLCHDIDHRGTNNKFQINVHSVLAALYTSGGSVMEHHHFAQTLGILNSDNCNIFCNLSGEVIGANLDIVGEHRLEFLVILHEQWRSLDYHQILDVVKEVILATDVAVHLRKLKHIQAMAADGVDGTKKEHHILLLSLLMTSCDLSACTKSWVDAQYYAELIYKEFFSQGDLERALELQPVEMMDRDKACIPEQQIGFIKFIALPVYEVLAKVYPRTNLVFRRLKRNLRNWVELKEKYWEASASGEDISEDTGRLSSSMSVIDELDEMSSGSEGRSSPPSSEDTLGLQIRGVHFEKDVDYEKEVDYESSDFELRARHKRSQSEAQSQLESTLSLLSIQQRSPDLTRASTGCINFKQQAPVIPAARSRHASTTMGVDCIMKVARLQAARGSVTLEPDFFLMPNSPWVSPKSDQAHVQMRVERVTDEAEPVLLNRVQSLEEACKEHDVPERDMDLHSPSPPPLRIRRRQGQHQMPVLETQIEIIVNEDASEDSPNRTPTMHRRPASTCPPGQLPSVAHDIQRVPERGPPLAHWPKTSDPTGKHYLSKPSVVAGRKFSDPSHFYLAHRRAGVVAQRFLQNHRKTGHSQSNPNLAIASPLVEQSRHKSDPGVKQNTLLTHPRSLAGSDSALSFKPHHKQAVTAYG